MKTFPTATTVLSRGESPSLYKLDWEDNVRKAPTDSGYEFRRRKFTRTPPCTIETGFIGLNDDDYETLEQFWLEHEMSETFHYYDYLREMIVTVVFDDFKPDYTGYGQTRLWNLKIKFKEV
mgnify:CR=1 FL=1